jgi:hypothetical protein
MTEKPKPLPPPRYTPRPNLTFRLGQRLLDWLRSR